MFSTLVVVYSVTELCFDQNRLEFPSHPSLCQWVLIAPVLILCNIFLMKCNTRIQILVLFYDERSSQRAD